MLEIIDADTFAQKRRESLLDYAHYQERFLRIEEGYRITEAAAARSPEIIKSVPIYAISVSRKRRAWNTLFQLSINYSAGHEVKELSEFYPTVLACWEDYSKWSKAYDDSPESEGAWVAQLPLLGPGYEQANRLICFAILLGHSHLLPRLMPIVDYRNPRTDALIERLVAPFVPGRGAPPDECTRHLPYFKTLEIFAAPHDKRPVMMAKYLADWYHASCSEPYHDSHERGINFFGYWSWEAAAITFLLDIDDSAYADAMFYPRDLVDFARSVRDADAPHRKRP